MSTRLKSNCFYGLLAVLGFGMGCAQDNGVDIRAVVLQDSPTQTVYQMTGEDPQGVPREVTVAVYKNPQPDSDGEILLASANQSLLETGFYRSKNAVYPWISDNTIGSLWLFKYQEGMFTLNKTFFFSRPDAPSLEHLTAVDNSQGDPLFKVPCAPSKDTYIELRAPGYDEPYTAYLISPELPEPKELIKTPATMFPGVIYDCDYKNRLFYIALLNNQQTYHITAVDLETGKKYPFIPARYNSKNGSLDPQITPDGEYIIYFRYPTVNGTVNTGIYMKKALQRPLAQAALN